MRPFLGDACVRQRVCVSPQTEEDTGPGRQRINLGEGGRGFQQAHAGDPRPSAVSRWEGQVRADQTLPERAGQENDPKKKKKRKRPWWNTCCLSVSWVKTQTVKSVTKYLENSEMENYNLQEQQEIGQQRKSTHRPLSGSSWTVYDILRSAPVIDLIQRHKGVCIMRVGKGWPKRVKPHLSEYKAKDNTIGGGRV